MPLSDPVPLELLPGLYSNETDRGAKGRYKAGNRVRFYLGLPESIGGWLQMVVATLEGKCRAIHDWTALNNDKVAAFGTSKKLYLVNLQTLYNITPFDKATDLYGGALAELVNPFTTQAAGSPLVNVAHTAHGRNIGDAVFYTATAPTFDGVTISGEYKVKSVTSADVFVIQASTNATLGAVNGGGTVDFGYEIPIGQENESSGLGWGAGPWGSGTYGTPRSESTIRLLARLWSLDSWGEDLIANPRGAGIYTWDFTNGYNARATAISGAPASGLSCLVSPLDRILIVFGAHDGTKLDPMFIRWSDSENFTIFTPAATNVAGDQRLDDGSEILTAVHTREEILILTDTTAYAMYHAGAPDVFGFRHFGDACGAAGPKSAIDYAGVIYWMGRDSFWKYDGSVRPIICDVHKEVFGSIERSQLSLVHAGTNTAFYEVQWFFAVTGETEISRYVSLNVLDGSWALGDVARTAWRDSSEFVKVPYAVDPSGVIYTQETGVDAAGADMGFSLETYDFEVSNGAAFARLQQMIPDFDRLTGTLKLYLKTRRKPHAAQVTKGPFSFTAATEYLRTKARGMQMAFRVESSGTGASMRMGTWRARFKPHGKK